MKSVPVFIDIVGSVESMENVNGSEIEEDVRWRAGNYFNYKM